MRILAVFLTFLAFFAACDRRPVQKDLPKSEGNSTEHSGTHHSDMASSPNAATAPHELQFLDTMITHHEAAIDMSQLADTRAGHEEIKTLARNIIVDQRKEIEEMRGLRGEYFAGASPAVNMDLPGMGDAMGEMDLDKLDDLKETAFDIGFIRQMVKHHEGAVVMAQNVIARVKEDSGNPGMSDAVNRLAQSIIDKQTAEIQQMQAWQAAWTK
jgi:uncharacterized protein (DUF305 family)